MLGQATGNTDSLDSPRPGFRGSHHLPPYSIICITPPHSHSNGSLSRDSQNGVPKLSRFGLPGLWAFITSCSDLRLGRGQKKSCNFPWELSNGVSHFTCTHRDRVYSWLLVVWSQIASLIFGPSFNRNFCYKCPNGSCEAISDIYTSRPFPMVQRTSRCEVFWPLQSCSEFLRVLEDSQVPFSGVWVATSHFPQSGVATI